MKIVITLVFCCFSLISAASAQSPDCQSLWSRRNAIFKKAGFCFKTPRAISAFGNDNCRFNTIEAMPLSEQDRKEINEISQIEVAQNCNPAVDGLSDHASINCEKVAAKGNNPVGQILCAGKEGAAADWDLNSALWAMTGSGEEAKYIAVDEDEERWRAAMEKRCLLVPGQAGYSKQQGDCVLAEFHNRANFLRSKLSGDALAESHFSPEKHAKIQMALSRKGLFDGRVDGEFGRKTRTAIIAFQQAQGASPTGYLTPSQADQMLIEGANGAPLASAPAKQDSVVAGISPAKANEGDMASPPAKNKNPTPEEQRAFTQKVHQALNELLRGTQFEEEVSLTAHVEIGEDQRLAKMPEIDSNETSAFDSTVADKIILAFVHSEPFEMFKGYGHLSYTIPFIFHKTLEVKPGDALGGPIEPKVDRVQHDSSSICEATVLQDVKSLKAPYRLLKYGDTLKSIEHIVVGQNKSEFLCTGSECYPMLAPLAPKGPIVKFFLLQNCARGKQIYQGADKTIFELVPFPPQDPSDVPAQVLNYTGFGKDEGLEHAYWFKTGECRYESTRGDKINFNELDPRNIQFKQSYSQWLGGNLFIVEYLGNSLITQIDILQQMNSERVQRGWALVYSKYCSGKNSPF